MQELQCEINYMHDSKNSKVAESMHSGQLSHVPSESALFPLQDDRGGLLGRAIVMPPNIWDTLCASGNFFASPSVYHLCQNDYSFDALQAYCFRINIKL